LSCPLIIFAAVTVADELFYSTTPSFGNRIERPRAMLLPDWFSWISHWPT